MRSSFSIFETTDESIKMCYLAKSRQIFDDFRQISSKNVIWPNFWPNNTFLIKNLTICPKSSFIIFLLFQNNSLFGFFWISSFSLFLFSFFTNKPVTLLLFSVFHSLIIFLHKKCHKNIIIIISST